MSDKSVGATHEAGTVHGFSWIERVALWYVVSPALLFFFYWLTTAVGLLVSLLYIGLIVTSVRHVTLQRPATSIWTYGIVVVVSMLWVAVGGTGGFFYANAFDWVPRFALARDLAEFSWPLSYHTQDVDYLVRAALGYYLVPAGFAKWIGLASLGFLLYLWTLLGVVLFFLVAFRRWSPWRSLLAIVIFVLASGLDLLGYFYGHEMLPDLGEHIEIWAPYLEYPSHTTQLFWAPNHSLAAWIATALLFRFRTDRNILLRVVPVLLPGLLLWSPLSGAGFGILWVGTLIGHGFRQVRLQDVHWKDIARAALLVVPFGILMLYLGAGFSSIPGPHRLNTGWLRSIDQNLLLFILVEGALPALLVLGLRISSQTVTAALLLVVLPFFQLGGANDLVMRTSIPAMAMIWLIFAEEVTLRNPAGQRHRQQLVLAAIVWLLGTAAPLQEIVRGILMPPWKPDLAMRLPEAFSRVTPWEPFPPHYFAKIDAGSGFFPLLAAPAAIESYSCRKVRPLGFSWAMSIPPRKQGKN